MQCTDMLHSELVPTDANSTYYTELEVMGRNPPVVGLLAGDVIILRENKATTPGWLGIYPASRVQLKSSNSS